jgi:hypothetical protein
MDPVSLVKALLINAAYAGAQAVCENTTGGGVPIDPLIQDTNLQGKGVMVYEEAKIQYAALLRAFQDKSGVWPDPKVNVSAQALPVSVNAGEVVTQLVPLVTKLLPLLSAIPALAPFIGPVQALLGVAAPKPAVPGAEFGSPSPAAPK